jgi:hypothetical protein
VLARLGYLGVVRVSGPGAGAVGEAPQVVHCVTSPGGLEGKVSPGTHAQPSRAFSVPPTTMWLMGTRRAKAAWRSRSCSSLGNRTDMTTVSRPSRDAACCASEGNAGEGDGVMVSLYRSASYGSASRLYCTTVSLPAVSS